MRRTARLLLYSGIVAAVTATGFLHGSLLADGSGWGFGANGFAWALVYMAVLAVSAYAVGLPDIPRSSRSVVFTATLSSLLSLSGISLAFLVAGRFFLAPFVVVVSAAVLAPWYVVCASVSSGFRARDMERSRALVVADPSESLVLEMELQRRPEKPAQIVATVDATELAGDEGREASLEDRALANDATVLVLDRTAQNDEQIIAEVAELHEQGMRVRPLPLFYEQWLGKVPMSEVERASLMFDISEVHSDRYQRVKRLVDLGCGILGLAFLVVLTPLVLLGNLVGNRGPLLYRQPRIGKGGKEFQIIKFRTMRPENGPSRWTGDGDERITAFGRILRASHLDELPQVLNILRGDLSIVGPRPEQPHYVEELREKIPFYDLRHLVRPGLTGWAQVKYPYGASAADAVEKLQYEFYYLRHQKLRLDLRIIARTLRSVVHREGR